eukprot:Colp12_sorted_trinity150504_noHs@11511
MVDSLLNRCVESICTQLAIPNRHGLDFFRANVQIPDDLASLLLSRLIARGDCNDYTISRFPASHTRLVRVDVSKTAITDIAIAKLASHPLEALSVADTDILGLSLEFLILCKATLEWLDVSGCRNIHHTEFQVLRSLTKLTALNLSRTSVEPSSILPHLPELRHLVLDQTATVDDSIAALAESPVADKLQTLSLWETKITGNSLQHFSCFKQLERLDLSDTSIGDSPFVDNLKALDNLRVLNISGTNMSENAVREVSSSLPKLNFLGICLLHMQRPLTISNVYIAGDHTVEQINNTLDVFLSREHYVFHSLKQLFNLYVKSSPKQNGGMIERLLSALQTHPHVGIHIAASASLYHLTMQSVVGQSPELRRKVVRALVESMERYPTNFQLQKNACLTLCNFSIPEELEHAYDTVVIQLLAAANNHADDLIRRIAVGLCNSLVCLGIEQKELIGTKGAIRDLLRLIAAKTAAREMDVVLETAWSSLWNVTDMTPHNCGLFVQEGGMELFITVLHAFPNEPALIRNMLGLLGNVAEVPQLRHTLMRADFLNDLGALVESTLEGIEVAYNAAGIICNLALVPVQDWEVLGISREDILDRMSRTVLTWDVSTPRSINYRSLKPIFELASCGVPQVQHWAAWAICNLCTKYPQRYCPLTIEDGGIPVLRTLALMKHETIAELALATLFKCQPYLGGDCMDVEMLDEFDMSEEIAAGGE